MIYQWKTIKEFEASPEDGIYFVYSNIRNIEDIQIAWYFNDKFYSGMYGSWWITHVMKITLPNHPNNA